MFQSLIILPPPKRKNNDVAFHCIGHEQQYYNASQETSITIMINAASFYPTTIVIVDLLCYPS